MVYKTLSTVEIVSADIGVSYTGWIRHFHASRVGADSSDLLRASLMATQGHGTSQRTENEGDQNRPRKLVSVPHKNWKN